MEPDKASPQQTRSPWQRYRSLGLGVRILIWMVIGAVAGLLLGERAAAVEPVGDLFIRLLMMAAVPLVFFNLLAGLTGLGDASALGRLATRTLGFFWATTLVALGLGLAAAALLQPGRGMQLTEAVQTNVGAVPNVVDLLLGFVPDNPVAAFAEANVVQVVVFAVLLGLGTLALPEDRRAKAADLYALGAELFRRLVDIVMYVAPVGIGALTAVALGVYGDQIFGPLGLFILGVIGGQLVMFAIYLVLLATMTDRPPLPFLRQTGTIWATTSATCSSLASLAVSLEVAERIRMPQSIYGFTLPLGAQINKDGTALFLAAVVAFTAQASGVEWSMGSLAMVMVIGLLLSQGSAGIPGGGFVISLVYVQALQLPLEIAAIVGGIYRLVDIGNTTFNVMGDMVGTAILERQESRKKAPA